MNLFRLTSKSIVLIFLSLFYFNANGQILDKKISKTEALEDFEVFKNALIDGHPGLYWYSNNENITQSFKDAEFKISDSLTYKEFHDILNGIIEEIACGHTSLNYPLDYVKGLLKDSCFLGINIAKFNDYYYVVNSKYSEINTGDIIHSINQKPIDEIVDELNNKIPTEKGILTKKEESLEILFPFYYSLYFEHVYDFEIELLNKVGSYNVKGVKMDRETMFTSPKNYAQSQIPIKFKTIDSNTVVLSLATLRSVYFRKYEINFYDTISKIFNYLNENEIENLIIDLRRNNGGVLDYGHYLLSYLSDNEIIYYDQFLIRESIATGKFKYSRSPNLLPKIKHMYGKADLINGNYVIKDVEPVIPDSNVFKGEVFFLSDGLTFSATSNFLAVCQENNIGKIIGETPGGSYNGCNGGVPYKVHLPNSKMFLFFYIVNISLNTNPDKLQISVDYPYQPKAEAIFNGTDDVMNYVLKIAESD